MKLEGILRLTKAEDVTFTKHRVADGTTGVLVVDAPLAKRDAVILGCGFLADTKFDSFKLGEDIEEISVELTRSGDEAPFELSPEKISKPTIEPSEDGLKIRLRVHVKDGHVGIIDGFFDRPHPEPFALVVRPLQGALDFAATEHPELPDTPKPDDDDVEGAPVVTEEQSRITGGVDLKFEGKKCRALISPQEEEGGWRAWSEARFDFRHAKVLPAEASDRFLSERQSIEAAAGRINEFVSSVLTSQPGQAERIAARMMQDWLSPYLSREQVVPAAEEAAEVTVQ